LAAERAQNGFRLAASGGVINLREVLMKGVISRLAVVAGTVAMLVAMSVVPVSAVAVQGPVLRVFNPNPGDTLPRGRLFFLGQAWDASATTGQGIDRVSVYSGDRDAGAIWLGTAAKATCQSGNCPSINGRDQGVGIQGSIGLSSPVNGWTIKSRVTLKRIHSGSMWFYARSSVTGLETIVKVDNVMIDPGRALGQVQP
jgi:hypothetical protein